MSFENKEVFQKRVMIKTTKNLTRFLRKVPSLS